MMTPNAQLGAVSGAAQAAMQQTAQPAGMDAVEVLRQAGGDVSQGKADAVLLLTFNGGRLAAYYHSRNVDDALMVYAAQRLTATITAPHRQQR